MKKNAFLPGAILILIGILFLGRNIGWIDYSLFRIFFSWQMLLIALGLGSFANKHYTGGMILTGIGTFFLLSRMDILWSGYVHTYWPLLLIFIGAALLFKHLVGDSSRRQRMSKEGYSSQDGYVHSDVALGSVKQTVTEPVFKGACLNNMFGGTILDLRQTRLEAPETYIDASCVFGGIEIYTPQTWVIVTDVNTILGGVEDKRNNSNLGKFTSDRKLIIRGRVAFGGLEIKD